MVANNKPREYAHIAVPTDLVVYVEKIIAAHPQLGYRTRSEFIIEAVREKVKSIEASFKNEKE